MKRYPFKKIDAFATECSAGNPAGYIMLESFDDITAAEMLRIAREMKGYVSEVGFVVRNTADSWTLRYFSAEREVEFCGHATIAILHDILCSIPRAGVDRTVTIHTNRGTLDVLDRIAEEGAVYIRAPNPERFICTLTRAEIASQLKLGADQIDAALPVSMINAGLTTLLVPIDSLDSVLSIAPEQARLREFCLGAGIDIVEVFTQATASERSAFRVRVFAPTFGYLEDPATGSGNSALGYYLLDVSGWDGQAPLVIEQNGERERFNVVRLMSRVDSKGQRVVYFGGRGLCRLEGTYMVP
jgi:PhzF family phenazine biosynthesis protein